LQVVIREIATCYRFVKGVLLFALVANLGTFQIEVRRIAKRFLRYMRGPLFVHLRLKVSKDLQRSFGNFSPRFRDTGCPRTEWYLNFKFVLRIMKLFFHSCYLALSLVVLSFSISPNALAWTRDEYTDEVHIGGLIYQIHYGIENDEVVGGNGILCGVAGDSAISKLDSILPFVTLEYSFYGKGPDLITGYVTAPVSLIGKYAFRNCTNLKSVTIPSFIETIYDDGWYYGAFDGCTGITELNWNARHCSTMGFMPKSNIERVSIGPEVELLPDGFVSGSKITNASIPNSVTSIGSGAFGYCNGLISITIPSSVTYLGAAAFRNCSGLTSVVLPESITKIAELTFSFCSDLKTITIPNSVTEIAMSAFSFSGLTSITIPPSVVTIGELAFAACTSLKSVQLPNTITDIGNMMFYECYDLTNVNIPNSVISIGSGAFMYCTSLTSVAIPNSVTSIGQSAFQGCSLNQVTCLARIPPIIESSCFMSSTYNNAVLYVPKGTLHDYQQAYEWKNFKNIVEIDENLPGDANGDGEVNITDISALIDVILSGEFSSACDVNDDGEINISDINAIIDIILNQ